eukprot:UN00735
MVFDSAKAPREKVIGVEAYFIYQSDSRAVVLTAVNYSDSLRVSHELVDDMDPSLRNNQKMVQCKDNNSSRLNIDFINKIKLLIMFCVVFWVI